MSKKVMELADLIDWSDLKDWTESLGHLCIHKSSNKMHNPAIQHCQFIRGLKIHRKAVYFYFVCFLPYLHTNDFIILITYHVSGHRTGLYAATFRFIGHWPKRLLGYSLYISSISQLAPAFCWCPQVMDLFVWEKLTSFMLRFFLKILLSSS